MKTLRSPIFQRLWLGAVLALFVTCLILDRQLARLIGSVGIARVSGVHQVVWEVFFLGCILAFAIAYFVSRSLVARILGLQRFADGLARSSSSIQAVEETSDEFGMLGRSLNRAAMELKNATERLSFESARLQAILASMVEGVLAVDNELRVTFCNQAFLRAVRFEGPTPEHLPLLEVVRDPSLLDILARVLVSGDSLRQRIQLAGPEGRALEIQAAPLAAPSRPGAIAIFHDITDLERLERVRTDFVANVSHELRTPLAAIRGYAETLLEGALDDREHNRQFLEIIKNHAIRLNDVAADLLTLTELESKAEPGAVERFSASEALQSACSMVEREAVSRGVHLKCESEEHLILTGERHRFEQAIVNLLNNGIRFNRPGGGVWVKAVQASDGRAQIGVTDTGIGIPSQDLNRIFERFYRVDKARSREVGGTGLGLSIVKHVIERMGGTIDVQSKLGEGSTFTLWLPADPTSTRLP